MNKKKILILFVLLLVAVIGLTTTVISAWLTDTEEKGQDTTFTVGDIEYVWSGEFITDQIIIPGQNIIKKPDIGLPNLLLVNNSTVKSQLRFKLTYFIDNENDQVFDTEVLYSDDVNGIVIMNVDGTKWRYDNGYFYCTIGTDEKIDTGSTILVTDSLMLNGATVGNDYSSKVFKFVFTFEAKQADFVNWDQLGTIDFETGLTKQA